MAKIKVVYGISGVDEEEFETEVTEKNTIDNIQEACFEDFLQQLESYGGLYGLPCEEDFENWDEYVQDAESWFEFDYEEI